MELVTPWKCLSSSPFIKAETSTGCPIKLAIKLATRPGHQKRPPEEATRPGHQKKPPEEATRRGHQNRPPELATRTGHQNRPPEQATRKGHQIQNHCGQVCFALGDHRYLFFQVSIIRHPDFSKCLLLDTPDFYKCLLLDTP